MVSCVRRVRGKEDVLLAGAGLDSMERLAGSDGYGSPPEMIPNAKSSILLGLIRQRTTPDNVIYTDALHAYDTLDASGFRIHRINHSGAYAINRTVLSNGIENSG